MVPLRFIPDNMTFDDRKPSSTASDSAHLVGYTPAQFVNTALQQSAVRLTWDETDRRRLSTTMKRYTREEAMSADLRDYLASSSDSGSEIENGNGNQDCFTEEDKLEKYKVRSNNGLLVLIILLVNTLLFTPFICILSYFFNICRQIVLFAFCCG